MKTCQKNELKAGMYYQHKGKHYVTSIFYVGKYGELLLDIEIIPQRDKRREHHMMHITELGNGTPTVYYWESWEEFGKDIDNIRPLVKKE